MDNTWYLQIQNKVITQIEYMMKKKYPKLICTTKNENGQPAKFPTLYLHELQPVEQGQDLTNETVNAVLSTIEIMVWTNTTETDCRNIIGETVNQMKLLQFNVIGMPIVQVNDKVSCGVMRCRRMIGNGDKIIKENE